MQDIYPPHLDLTGAKTKGLDEASENGERDENVAFCQNKLAEAFRNFVPFIE